VEQPQAKCSEAEFDKLLGAATQCMNQKLHDKVAEPKSPGIEIADGRPSRGENKMNIPRDTTRGLVWHEGLTAPKSFLATLFSAESLPIRRDLGLLVLTVMAVAVCASCVQNLTLTPSSTSVPTQGSAVFTASYSLDTTPSLMVAWTLTNASSGASCSPGCGFLTFPANLNAQPSQGAGAVFNAPPNVPSPNTLTLTVTVTDRDGSKSAQSAITVTQATGPTVSVSPSTESFTAGNATAQPFTAAVTPDPESQGVTW
jgi:hypothetical protein